jgi:hypothetical protein
MVDQPSNGRDAGLLQGGQALVRPAPVGRGETVRRGAFPQDRIADGVNAERGEAGDVIAAVGVAVALDLGKVTVLDAVDSALEAAPKL